MSSIGPFQVSRQGFGAMGLSHNYGHADEAESLRTLERVLELGINLIDTANVYGAGHNEELVGRAIRGRRDQVVIASKVGIVGGGEAQEGAEGKRVNNSPAYTRLQAEKSLKRLGVEQIDLYYLHRIDASLPIEEAIGGLVRLKEEGKIGAIGLSEATAETVRRAHAVHPIAALQSEYSLWTREVETEILPTTREMGVTFVPFSPLGRGFLAGASAPEDAEDVRHRHPRFQAEAVEANARRRAAIEGVAGRLGATSAQVALAWVLSKNVVPIPGTRRVSHLESNWAANDLQLDQEVVAELETAFPVGVTIGARFPENAPAQGPS
jgi:aryl-alcohol dehydrogenase-like predicted oxidoreductase